MLYIKSTTKARFLKKENLRKEEEEEDQEQGRPVKVLVRPDN